MQHFRALLAIALPIVLAGCGGGPAAPSSVPLPQYGAGDSYRFDDGMIRTVVSSNGDTVTWRGNHGETLVTGRDAMLPPRVEDARNLTIRRDVPDAGLFPLAPGRRAAFVVTTELLPHAGPRHGSQQAWDCRAGDQSAVTTPAGMFDTISVKCLVREPSPAPLRWHTYFYAPSIGYYVRREDRVGDGPVRRTDLVHYATGNPVLTDTALGHRSAAIQAALEHRVSGTEVAWHDSASDAGGTVEPVLTEHSPRFGWCREFREHLHVSDRDYDLLGTACRDQGGAWLVKEVTPETQAAKAG